jgi:hypothetical protein
LNFNITLKNSGNTHIQPSGKVNIYNDLNGELIESFDLSSSIVLPGTSKSFPVEGNLSQLVGKFSMESVIKYGSDGEVIKSSRQSFVIFPYTVFLFAVLPFAVLMFFIIKYRRRFIRAYKVLFGRNKRRQKVLDKGTIGRDLLKPRSGLKTDFNSKSKGRVEIPKNLRAQNTKIAEVNELEEN